MEFDIPNIPIIDCSGLFEANETSETFRAFTKTLGEAMSQVGFAYFVNHGVDSSTVSCLFCIRIYIFKVIYIVERLIDNELL
jgi:isopenicillin N synthase-like dioxygenase